MTIDLEDEFPVNRECAFLDHAAVAPWPRRSLRAVERFASESCTVEPGTYSRWEKTESRLRSNLAQIIGADSPDLIGLVKSTSEALSIVAYGLDWAPGDLVLISDQEFPSNRIVWESLASKGVRVKAVPLPADDPERELLEAIRSLRPRLLSVSAVQYATGLRLDLSRLGEACRPAGVLFCVDAIQAAGAMPLDLSALAVDFAMADGHKWMLGPEGLGFLYVGPQHLSRLILHEFGWHMVEAKGDFERLDWTPASTARRFECGSPNLLGCHALEASTGLLLECGLERVRTRIRESCAFLASELRGLGATISSPTDPARSLGILTFRFDGVDSRALAARLASDRVVCAARGGGIRFSPHFHTTREVLERAIDSLARALGRS